MLLIVYGRCARFEDYEIELINGYRVVKSSPQTISIYPAQDSLDDIVVPDYNYFKDDFNDKKSELDISEGVKLKDLEEYTRDFDWT